MKFTVPCTVKLGGIGCLCVVVLSACAGVNAIPTSPSTRAVESSVAAAAPTAERTASAINAAEPLLGPELAAVRRATAAFHNPDKAVAAGYVVEELCVSSPAGAMGHHAPNRALIGTQTLDPEQPEVLLYLEKPGGGLRLIGVEYLQIALVRNPATGQVGPWISPSPWPAEYQVITPTPQMFGHTFQGPMPGHSPTMPWHWDLHVWVWTHNPSGMFAQWNPTLSCS